MLFRSNVQTIVHELGHALDHHTHFDLANPEPVSDYANTNRSEAFAEAFVAWCWGNSPAHKRPDDQTLAFFRSLEE